MEFVECVSVGSRPEAELICQFLFTQRIRCVVSCDDAGGGLPQLFSPSRVMVEKQRLREAQEIVNCLHITDNRQKDPENAPAQKGLTLG